MIKKILDFLAGSDHTRDLEPRVLGNPAPYAETRHDPRHSTGLSRVAWAELREGSRIDVRDISYGGIAFFVEDDILRPHVIDSNILPLKLHIYHLSVDTRVSVIHSYRGITGCAFVHSDTETLQFLRDILEYIRLGTTLAAQPKDQVDRKYKGDKHSVFHGECDTSIILSRSISGSIEHCEMSFRDGEILNHVHYQDGRISFQRIGDRYYDSRKALDQGLFLVIGMIEQHKLINLNIIAEAFKETIESLASRK